MIFLSKIMKTWYKLIARVNGANSASIYISENGNMTGYNKIKLPPGHNYKSFCNLLLSTMPKITREHYIERFRGWLLGWKDRGYVNGIPDEAPLVLEKKYWAPSWRRLCKVLLRNDWWCKGLGLTQPKSEAYGRYLKLKKENSKKRGEVKMQEVKLVAEFEDGEKTRIDLMSISGKDMFDIGKKALENEGQLKKDAKKNYRNMFKDDIEKAGKKFVMPKFSIVYDH